MLVVHPHWHSRRTGVTRHVESMVTVLKNRLDIRMLGTAWEPDVPKIEFSEIWRRAKTERIVWHAHRNIELLGGLLLRCCRPNVKVVFTRHSATAPGRYTKLLAGAADARIALTAEGRTALKPPVAIIGHGVDETRFHPTADKQAAWAQKRLGGTRGVGVVGRIRPQKGQGDFLEAITPLLEEFKDWTPVLVGRVRPKDKLWFDRARQPLGDKLVLAGEVDDVLSWYQGLSVVVQPSHSEGFGLVLLEAMASGCCVIAAKLPHYEQILEDGVTGFFYEPGNVQALRERLRFVFENPQQVQSMGRAAAEWVRKRWSIAHEAEDLAQLYAGATRIR